MKSNCPDDGESVIPRITLDFQQIDIVDNEIHDNVEDGTKTIFVEGVTGNSNSNSECFYCAFYPHYYLGF